MIANARHWFLARSRREQLLLTAMLALALPLLAWLLVYRPVDAALTSARARNVAAVHEHGRVVAQLAQLKQTAPATSTPATGDLALLVSVSAGRHGVVLASNSMQGPDAMAFVTQAGPVTAPLRWLQELEEQGVAVRELQLTPAPGGVSVTGQVARVGR